VKRFSGSGPYEHSFQAEGLQFVARPPD
jgi:hypothetical protein